MGSGKTTVSRCLERKYGFRRLEMDALIEEKAHMSISEIFRTQGEQGFRRMETDLLLKIAKKKSDADPDTVLSAGGGTVLREENRKLLKEIADAECPGPRAADPGDDGVQGADVPRCR